MAKISNVRSISNPVNDAPNLLPSVNTLFHPVRLEAYVCGTCGYRQYFVPAEELARARGKWKRH